MARLRAERLAAAGFGPPVHGLRDGFLAYEVLDGLPNTSADVDAQWIQAIARYLAFVSTAFPSDSPTSPESLEEMMRANVRHTLGHDAAARRVDRLTLPLVNPVWGDARMLPHEWVRGAAGLWKTDGVEHATDHFYPGSTDIAWDLAGAIAELRLSAGARAALIESYARASGDDPRARLPAYEVAYLAYRAAYATVAQAALTGSSEQEGFALLASRYRRDLVRALGRRPTRA